MCSWVPHCNLPFPSTRAGTELKAVSHRKTSVRWLLKPTLCLLVLQRNRKAYIHFA